MNPSLSYIGSNIRRFRKNRKWTQEEMARRASISRIALIHVESGKALPTLDTLAALAQVLEIPMSTLLAKPNELMGAAPMPTESRFTSTPEPLPADFECELAVLTSTLRGCSLQQVVTLRKIIESLLANFGAR